MGAFTLLAIAISAAGVMTITVLNQTIHEIADNRYEKIVLGMRLEQTLTQINRTEKSLILARTQKAKAELTAKASEEIDSVRNLKSLFEQTLTAEEAELFSSMNKNFDRWEKGHMTVRNAVEKGKAKKAIRVSDGKNQRIIDDMQAVMAEVIAKNREEMIVRRGDAADLGDLAFWGISVFAASGTVLVLIFVVVGVRKKVLTPMPHKK